MRANLISPLRRAAGGRALPLAGVLAVLLAGCTTVPLPPWPPLEQPPQTMPPPGVPQQQPEPPQAPPDAPPVRDPQLAAFSTRLDGRNVVPPAHSMGSGVMDAVLDRESGLFRWRITFSNLSGPVTAMNISGPADVGANASPLITFGPPFESPWEGQLKLTSAQSADLLSGRWYITIHTARNPSGELRGQLVERR